MPKTLLLVGISGSRLGQQIPLAGRIVLVGSAASCTIILHDRQVLSRHAELRQSLDRWFIAPLDPSALVAINGQRVNGQSRVSEGDLVTIGAATFRAAVGEAVEFGGRK